MTVVRNTSDLRALLIDAIEGVRKGKLDPKQAQAIGGLSGRILQSAKLDLEVMRMTGESTLTNPLALVGSTEPVVKSRPRKGF